MTLARNKARYLPQGATVFEDIIDGYFPLSESLRQMMQRNGFVCASVTLTHAPIMDIPGLGPTAPVPLRLDTGTAGIADRLDILISLGGDAVQLSGYGRWRWYRSAGDWQNLLPAHTRLAEPSIVAGIGHPAGAFATQVFRPGRVWQHADMVITHMPKGGARNAQP